MEEVTKVFFDVWNRSQIVFGSVELVTSINVISGNDHNFFSISGIGHINKCNQWKWSQFFLVSGIGHISKFQQWTSSHFFIFGGISHIFKWNQWKWSQFFSNQWKWSQFFSSVILFLRSWWGHSPGALRSQVHSSWIQSYLCSSVPHLECGG